MRKILRKMWKKKKYCRGGGGKVREKCEEREKYCRGGGGGK